MYGLKAIRLAAAITSLIAGGASEGAMARPPTSLARRTGGSLVAISATTRRSVCETCQVTIPFAFRLRERSNAITFDTVVEPSWPSTAVGKPAMLR